MIIKNDWILGEHAWDRLTETHPELGYKSGLWPFHNFLRLYRAVLVDADAIRKVRNRHWIAHVDRFLAVAFDCATGFTKRVDHV